MFKKLFKTQFNSLPSIITAVCVGIFVSWLIAGAAASPGIILPGRILPPPPPPAAIDIKADSQNGPLTLIAGGSATLSWTTGQNVANCSASGSWSGSKPNSGSQSTGVLAPGSYTYTMLCFQNGDIGVSDSVTINVQPAPLLPPDCLLTSGTFITPSQNPPDGNVSAPLDTSSMSQVKTGCLGINNHLVADNLALNVNNGFLNALVIPFGQVDIGARASLKLSGKAKLWGPRQEGVSGFSNQQVQFNTTYTADSDGLVLANISSFGGARCRIAGHYGNPKVVGGALAYDQVDSASFTIPVYKDSKWSVDLTHINSGTGQCQGNLFYFPLGGGASVASP